MSITIKTKYRCNTCSRQGGECQEREVPYGWLVLRSHQQNTPKGRPVCFCCLSCMLKHIEKYKEEILGYANSESYQEAVAEAAARIITEGG
jgi:hypothetical protein